MRDNCVDCYFRGMLHYAGDIEAHELGEKGKFYLQLYARAGEPFAYVPFKDLERGRKRYIKYEWMLDQWVYVDLVEEQH
jgi:hypothetical protein